MQQAIASRNTSTVNYVIAALLWLPLIALSGYLGGLIGNEISGGGGGAIVGGVVGVIGVQAIYVGLFPRRR